MHKTNLDDLVKLTIRHYRNQRKVKEGNRQARELQSIMKGQLLQNPEYIARKKKERMKSLLLKGERKMPLSTINRSP